MFQINIILFVSNASICTKTVKIALPQRLAMSATAITPQLWLDSEDGDERVDLICNFVKLNNVLEQFIHRHVVEFRPDSLVVSMRSQMLREYVGRSGLDIGELVIVGDVFYTPYKVPHKQHDPNAKISMAINWVGQISLHSQESVPILEFLSRKILKQLNFTEIGGCFFNPESSRAYKELGVSLWPGITSSIRLYDGGLMLKIEEKYKVIHDDNMLDVINEWISGHRPEMNIMDNSMIVMTPCNNETYRLLSICPDLTPEMTFERNGVRISYIDYYKSHHNLTIRNPHQPLLLARSPKRFRHMSECVYLVPELCVLTGFTLEQKRNPAFVHALCSVGRHGTGSKFALMHNHISSILNCDNVHNKLKAWGIVLGRKMVELTGHVLPKEIIHYDNTHCIQLTSSSTEWTKYSKNVAVRIPVNLVRHQWVMIYNGRDFLLCKKLYNSMLRMAGRLNIVIDEPTCVEVRGIDCHSFVTAIREGVKKVGNMFNILPQLVLIMVPNDAKERYDAIKQECCNGNAIPSQIVVSSTARKDRLFDAIVVKILNQMNCKMGGTLWKMTNKFKAFVMHVGFDSYIDLDLKHDIGAAVFSTDREWTKWYTTTKPYASHTQLLHNLNSQFIEGLTHFKRVNGQLPEAIFFWRDGATAKKLPMIVSLELPSIIQTLCFIYGVPNEQSLTTVVQFTMITVTKQTLTRFFRVTSEGAAKNAPGGTVVNSVVTTHSHGQYDFYLIPQANGRSTASPVKYDVIYDRSMLGPDKIHLLAYKMCHLYYNWTGSVRVPAPCLYAHKAALFIANNLHKPMHPTLLDKLVYL